jgi:group I intron endonuclease
MAKKKKKPKYNQSSAVISALKRTFSRSPVVDEVKKSVRTEHDQFKKDGTLAKRKAVRFECAECNKIHMGKDIQVDHLESVVPLNIPAKHVCMDDLINRLFCSKNNLQVLCKPCHKIKSKEENITRREWKSKTKEKHLVYRTTNKLNGKFYVGIHSTFDYDDGYLGSGKAILASIKKYGKDQFYRKILFAFDSREDAFKKEAEIVNEAFVKNSNTYNLMPGGYGVGRKHTAETKVKLSNSHTGKTMPPVSQKTRDKLSKVHLGKKKKKSSAIKSGLSRRGMNSGNDNHKAKAVINCRGQEFITLTEAGKTFNVDRCSISKCCNGHRSSAGKYLDGTPIKWDFNKLDK